MPDLVVYAAAPIGERTAGPEAITQFVDALRRRGIESYLVPMRNHRGRRNDAEYDIYDFEVTDRIRKPEEAVLVVPEISPIESARELRAVPRERTWLGWFSVTNCPDPRARYFRPSERCCPTYPPGHEPTTPPVPADLGLGTALEPGPFATWREARRRGPGRRPTAVKSAAIDTVVSPPPRAVNGISSALSAAPWPAAAAAGSDVKLLTELTAEWKELYEVLP